MKRKTTTMATRLSNEDKHDFVRLCIKFEKGSPCSIIKQLVQKKHQELKLKEIEECQKTK